MRWSPEGRSFGAGRLVGLTGWGCIEYGQGVGASMADGWLWGAHGEELAGRWRL
jgi:hypothetical protein